MRKEPLSWLVRTSKYGANAVPKVVESETRRVTDPLWLTLAIMARGTVQFASLKMRAGMLGNMAAIRRASGYLVGEEPRAKNLLAVVGSDLGAWEAGPELLVALTFEAMAEFLFFFPFLEALDVATWEYKGGVRGSEVRDDPRSTWRGRGTCHRETHWSPRSQGTWWDKHGGLCRKCVSWCARRGCQG